MDKSIKKNAIFNLIYQLIALLLPLITTPYISRTLCIENVGIQSYTLSIVSYFTLFAAFGINDYGQREIARNRNNKEKISQIFWELVSNRLLTTFIVAIVYIILALTSFESGYRLYYLIMIMNILTIAFDITWFFQGLENFKTLAIRNSLVKIILAALVFIFVKEENDLWIYILINSASLLISSLSVWLVIFKYLVRVKIKFKNVLYHFKGALVYFIPTVAIQIYTILDKSMIQWITGSNAENGAYDQAEKLAKVSLTIIQILNNIMRSRLSYLFEVKDFKKAEEMCDVSISFLSFLMYPMTCGVILISSDLIPLYLGAGYEKSIILLQIFSFLIIFIGISGLIGSHYLTPVGKQARSNIALIVGAIVNFCLNLVLIPRLNSVGAAIASTIAEAIIAILYICFAKEFIKPKKFLILGLKNIIAAVAMFVIVTLIFKSINLNLFLALCIKVILGVSIYFIVLLILKDKYLLSIINRIREKVLKK